MNILYKSGFLKDEHNREIIKLQARKIIDLDKESDVDFMKYIRKMCMCKITTEFKIDRPALDFGTITILSGEYKSVHGVFRFSRCTSEENWDEKVNITSLDSIMATAYFTIDGFRADVNDYDVTFVAIVEIEED